MNLFEATKLLQSVGYSITDNPAWAKFDRICEAVIARIPEPEMLNEMGMKVPGVSEIGAEVQSIINSIDSKRSNFKAGKTQSTSIGDKVYDKYVAAWNALQTAVDNGDANEADAKVYRKFIDGGYNEALENDDINAIHSTNSTHGAKDGLDFNTAVAQGNIKRAIQCLKNSRRSGGGERAIASMKDKLATIMQMDGAEAYETELAALDSAINGLTAGSRGSRNADTYILDAGESVNSAKRILDNYGVTYIENEDGTLSFVTTPSKAEAVNGVCERRNWSITKQERERKPVSQKVTRTIYVMGTPDDYTDVADVVLSSKKGIEYTEGENQSYTITGTPAKVQDAIESISNLGIEFEEDTGA